MLRASKTVWLLVALVVALPNAYADEKIQTFRDPLTAQIPGPEMVIMPAATFLMGFAQSEAGRYDDEGPRFEVRISKPFALARTEVTVAQFHDFVDATRYETDAETTGCYLWNGKLTTDRRASWNRLSGYTSGAEYPLVCVSWNDARAYARWLSAETGKPYRLPTEAEWEHAARGGSNTARFWGDDIDCACEYANVSDQTNKSRYPDDRPYHHCTDGYPQLAPVGSFRANAFGLHDMLGNAWEWTCSVFSAPYNEHHVQCAPDNVRAPRVLRGGAWYIQPAGVRSAHRNAGTPTSQAVSIGFRVAREID